jgi:hypothetical protein
MCLRCAGGTSGVPCVRQKRRPATSPSDRVEELDQPRERAARLLAAPTDELLGDSHISPPSLP